MAAVTKVGVNHCYLTVMGTVISMGEDIHRIVFFLMCLTITINPSNKNMIILLYRRYMLLVIGNWGRTSEIVYYYPSNGSLLGLRDVS